MEFRMFKRNWYWALVVIIILGIGSFVVFRPKTQVETVKVYKTVTPAPKPTLAEISETGSLSDAQAQSLQGTVAVLSEPETVETRSVDETEAQEGAPTERDEISQETPANAGESEKRYFGDYTKEELVQIRDWGKDLEARLMEKYPEFSELTRMTPEEIAQKYPTDEDRVQLAARAQEFFDAYLEETHGFLLTVPDPIRKLVIAKLHLQLAENWGRAKADQAMTRFADLMQ